MVAGSCIIVCTRKQAQVFKDALLSSTSIMIYPGHCSKVSLSPGAIPQYGPRLLGTVSMREHLQCGQPFLARGVG